MTEEMRDPSTVRPGEYVGTGIRRSQDERSLRGDATYVRDLDVPGAAHAAVVRSQYGHAAIDGIHTAEAESLPGVIAVLTAADLRACDALGAGRVPVKDGPAGEFPTYTHRPLLVEEKARYTGDGLALVLAEDRETARDALSLVDVDYDRREALTSPEAALDSDARVHDRAASNTAFEWGTGDPDAVATTMDAADQVVDVSIANQRLVPNPIETRGVVAEYDPTAGTVSVTMSTQTPHYHRNRFAEILGVPEHRLEVRAPDVGGAFGSKSRPYPDEVLAVWAALYLERTVRWIPTRTESYHTDVHGRGYTTEASMALDRDGRIRALQVNNLVDLGAYVSNARVSLATNYHAGLLSNQYEIDEIHCDVTGVFTNTVPLDAYRGVSEVRAIQTVERLVKTAATERGVDPVALRRRNLIPADEFPYPTPTGMVYDSGDYEPALERALEALEYDDLRDRQATLREEGTYIGIGLCPFVEISGFGPSKHVGGGGWESGRVQVHPSGTVTVYAGTADHGQGHGTVYAQIVADELGVPFEDVAVVEGETDRVARGTGSFASRSVTVAGGAIRRSVDDLRETARTIAAHTLEADPADLTFEDGAFHVAGAPERSVSIQEVASIAHSGAELPEGVEPGLDGSAVYDPENFTFPFGVHAAVAEVDPDTGDVSLDRHVVVEDCGPLINPTIVEGQIHGGVAQGIGQALWESAEYNDIGTMTTGSHTDYTLPRANELPEIEVFHTVTPSPHNPLGVKGMGESGTIGAPTAVANAVIDALEPFDVSHIDMPMTPERVWRAIHEKQE